MMTHRRPVTFVPLVFATVVLLLASGCADDSGPEDFTAAVHDGMMEGCAEDDTDPDVVEVCECTYDTLAEDLSFAEFERIEDRLAQGEERLPGSLTDAIRECIRSVSGDRAGQG
jgi:hypothetical protein